MPFLSLRPSVNKQDRRVRPLHLIQTALLMALLSIAAPAQAVAADAQRIFDAHAYTGTVSEGIAALEVRLKAAPRDENAALAKGILEIMEAARRLSETARRRIRPVDLRSSWIGGFGVFSRFTALPPAGGSGLSADYEPMTYRALRSMLERFVADLERAEATLATVQSPSVKLRVRPFRIGFDNDGNGRVDPQERVLIQFLGAAMPRATRNLFNNNIENSELAFDAADASWFQGYTNLVLGTTKLLLAVDFERTYDAVGHWGYGLKATALGRMLEQDSASSDESPETAARRRELQTQLDALPTRAALSTELADIRRKLRALPRTGPGSEPRDALNTRQVEILATRGDVRRKRRALQRQLRELDPARAPDRLRQYAIFADLIAGLHTLNMPVISRKSMEEFRQHLIKVCDLNETTWQRARAETDNDREWLPNAKQTPPFSAPVVTDDIIDAWLKTTGLLRHVLNGKTLIRHPRFAKGVNVKRFLETTPEFDPVMIATGHALQPYLQDGEALDGQTLDALMRPMGRNAGTFAVWFN